MADDAVFVVAVGEQRGQIERHKFGDVAADRGGQIAQRGGWIKMCAAFWLWHHFIGDTKAG